MIKHGVLRAYASSLQKVIAANTSNRIRAFFAGMAVTAILQSSTATAMICASFASKQMIGTASGIAVVIGADVGTTIVAQVLTFDLSWLTPLLLIGGLLMHQRYKHMGKLQHLARSFIGLGLVLLSLTLIKESASVLGQMEMLPVALSAMEGEPILALVITALMTWLLHSSLAAVLIIASFTSSGLITLKLGLLLVLGANLGAAIAPFIMTYNMSARTRHITTGNLIMRLSMVFILFPILGAFITFSEEFHLDAVASREIINFHMLFNVLLAVLFLPFVKTVALLCRKLIPKSKTDSTELITPLYLDENALSSPALALACAARETLRVAKIVENMFVDSMSALKKDDPDIVRSIEEEDDKVDILHTQTKFYLARITEEALDPEESDRFIQILNFSTNLEHIGDIIDNSLTNIIINKIEDQQYHFSEAGFQEIQDFHEKVLGNMKIAQAVFMSEDPKLARQLLDSKTEIREDAEQSLRAHFQRLRDGVPESQTTSTLHNDIIRDFKRINSYITTVAYNILEKADDKDSHPKPKVNGSEQTLFSN